ncbi:unnamed protein product, partial [marine sediment metagenome]
AGKVQGIVPAKPSTPILANVLVQAKGDTLTLQATDSTISVRASAKTPIEIEGAIALPARHLFQLLRELTTPSITLSCTDGVAILEAGESKFKLQSVDASLFPAFPELSSGPSLSMKGEDFRKILTKTAFAAAKDNSRPFLNGVMMKRAENLATFTSTDGKRLARNQIEVQQKVETPVESILPLKAVEEIIKMLDRDEDVTLSWIEKSLCIESGATTLVTKLLSGQYPDVSRVIPERGSKPISLHKE